MLLNRKLVNAVKHFSLEPKCLELIPSLVACCSVTLGKFTSLCFDFSIYKIYLLHRVVERIKCVTIRCLDWCLALGKHSEVSFKKMSVWCGVGEGCEWEYLCSLENDGQHETQDPFLSLGTPNHP